MSFIRSDLYFFANTTKGTSLIQLAISVVVDLGLTKHPDTSDPASRSVVEDAAHLRDDVQTRARHASDSRRAVLGVYYITSM